MSTDPIKTTVVGRPVSAVVLRIGSHPFVYGIVGLGVLGVVAFFLLIVPAVRDLQPNGGSSVADAKARYEAASARFEAEKKVIGNAAALTKEQRELLAFALPAEADTPGMSVLLHAIGSTVGARVTGIDVSSVAPANDAESSSVPSGLSPVDVVVSVDGISYFQFKLLLAAFDNSLRLMDVRNMNFAPSSNSASLDIRTYYLR